MIESVWETRAIPAASEVSFPYAPGTTTVLSPSGIAREHIVHIRTVLENGILNKRISPINTMGNTISLRLEAI